MRGGPTSTGRAPAGSTVGAALACALALAACDGARDPVATGTPRAALEIEGGASLGREELASFDAYYEALDPTIGLRHRRAVLLERHFVPLALARAAFPGPRATARERAGALCSVVGNALELRRSGGEELGPLARSALPVPVAAWARDESLLGAVSPPLETADAVLVVALLELQPGFTPVHDHLRLGVVRFPAHDQPDFAVWLLEEQARRKGRVLHCDPDLRAAVPAWLAP